MEPVGIAVIGLNFGRHFIECAEEPGLDADFDDRRYPGADAERRTITFGFGYATVTAPRSDRSSVDW